MTSMGVILSLRTTSTSAPQFSKKMNEVVGEAVIVIDQNEHRLSVSKPIALVTYHGRKLEI